MPYRMMLAVSASLSLLAGSAFAGEFTDKVDRFTGTRSVGWTSVPAEENAFSLTSRALMPKGVAAPGSYLLYLDTWSSKRLYSSCNHTVWLVDGEPAPWVVTQYESRDAGPVVLESFSFKLAKSEAERFASAKTVEFRACTTEGMISQDDLQGFARVVSETK